MNTLDVSITVRAKCDECGFESTHFNDGNIRDIINCMGEAGWGDIEWPSDHRDFPSAVCPKCGKKEE